MIKIVDEIKDDHEYRESVIKEVVKTENGYDITSNEGWSLYINNVVGIEPKIGDTIRTYGRGLGFSVRGVAINNDVVWYRTRDEDAKYNQELVDEEIRKDKQRFEYNKYLLDYKYGKLPEVFKKRIDTFRKNNPDFRWEYEAYEIFCSEQALEIAKSLGNVEALFEFRKLNWKEQIKRVEGLSDAHSGNTFGFSCLLARAYLENPEILGDLHGALCVLVGCNSYGCKYGYKYIMSNKKRLV